ncbi:MAG: serine hydrolase [Planctomycetota bacterium]
MRSQGIYGVAVWLASAGLSMIGVRAQDGVGAPAAFTDAWPAVEARFHALCEQHGVVGGALQFVRGADELGFAAHGLADRDAGRAVDRDTIFHWASCTKTLTGIAVMQLRDRGRLRLEQPIVELVPELREVHDPFGPIEGVQIRHLMSHSAGFRGATWPWGGDRDWHPHEPTRWSQLVAMMPYTEVEFGPGTKFSYSNPGIVFLGRAIERLSGDDYEVYMEKNVLRPLGMRSSYFDVTPYHLQRHRAHSYRRDGDRVTDHGADFDTGVTVSNGGLNAPLPDMARYLAFLLGAAAPTDPAAAVLNRTSLEEMWRPVLPTSRADGDSIGLCFFVQERQGQRFATHTGGQRDFVSFFHVHPESGTGALGAFNTSTAGPVMAELRRLCMDLSLRLAPAAGGGDPGELEWRGRRLRLDRSGEVPALLLTVATGGHALRYEEARRDGDTVELRLCLTTPGSDEMVTQAFEDLRAEIPAADLGDARRARVVISTWRRGVQYVRAPDHEPAGTLALR